MNCVCKKKEIFKQLLSKSTLLICPICHESLNIQGDSLKCINNHTFNINNKGFTCLLNKSKIFTSDIYNKELFENRRIAILSGLYEKIHLSISEFINKTFPKGCNILEIGCGEATHSYKIKSMLTIPNTFIATDLSKQAIELSTNYLTNDIIPICCDANNLPILSKSINVVLDILSPYNYNEINRVLANDGFIIKVFPDIDYLKEIREIIHKQEYTKQEEVMNNFCQHFNIISSTLYKQTYNINEDLNNALVNMTPLTNKSSISESLKSITISLKIVIAQIKHNWIIFNLKHKKIKRAKPLNLFFTQLPPTKNV